MTRHSDTDADLGDLYEQVPQPGCQGHCWAAACRVAPHSDREHQRMRAAGVRVPFARDVLGAPATRQAVARFLRESPAGGGLCPALTAGGRCAVYEVRPMICRLWGAAESMPCPWGCRPAGGLLPAAESDRLMVESLITGGSQGET